MARRTRTLPSSVEALSLEPEPLIGFVMSRPGGDGVDVYRDLDFGEDGA